MFISSHALRDSGFSPRCCCAALLLCFRLCGNFSTWSCTMQSRRCRGGGTCVVPRDGCRLPQHPKYRRGRAPTVSFQTHACLTVGLGTGWKKLENRNAVQLLSARRNGLEIRHASCTARGGRRSEAGMSKMFHLNRSCEPGNGEGRGAREGPATARNWSLISRNRFRETAKSSERKRETERIEISSKQPVSRQWGVCSWLPFIEGSLKGAHRQGASPTKTPCLGPQLQPNIGCNGATTDTSITLGLPHQQN